MIACEQDYLSGVSCEYLGSPPARKSRLSRQDTRATPQTSKPARRL